MKDSDNHRPKTRVCDAERDLITTEAAVGFPTDRAVNTTDTNEYATGVNDETQWDRDLWDRDLPLADEISDAMNEDGVEDRQLYDENGFERDME